MDCPIIFLHYYQFKLPEFGTSFAIGAPKWRWSLCFHPGVSELRSHTNHGREGRPEPTPLWFLSSTPCLPEAGSGPCCSPVNAHSSSVWGLSVAWGLSASPSTHMPTHCQPAPHPCCKVPPTDVRSMQRSWLSNLLFRSHLKSSPLFCSFIGSPCLTELAIEWVTWSDMKAKS